MAGRSLKSFGSANKDWAPGSPTTRYNVSGKSREFYTFENAPGIGNYATGGTIIDGGDGYIYHIFTGPGTFQVSRPSEAIDSIDYMIVAGGGGSASPNSGNGGGGGGGMLFGNTGVSNAPVSYPVVVGAGGGSTPGTAPARNGNPSTAFGLIATGGGGGGAPPGGVGAGGGSGGGGSNPLAAAGAGNSPATIPRQGNPGGTGGPLSGGGGGGGGAGGIGANGAGPPATGGAGGPGRIDPNFPATIVGKGIPAPNYPTWYPLVNPGGYSSGGSGTPNVSVRSNVSNSGNGGQGSSADSGIVCVRYKKTIGYSRATGGTIEPNTHPEHPGVWRHIFTGPDTFTVTDPSLTSVDYLAVGGGGGGGSGGGGAGGFVTSIHTSTTTPTATPEGYPWISPAVAVQVGKRYSVSVGSYPIGIGTGGNASSPDPASNRNGGNTTIGSPGPSQIIAYGGGGGGGNDPVAPFVPIPGAPGASGGGGSRALLETGTVSGGTATPTPLIQGNPGAASPPGPGVSPTGFSAYSGGGGAGATGSGSATSPPYTGGAGGAGWYSVLSPSAYGTPGPLTPNPQYRYFAGGGGGGGGSGPGGSGAGSGGSGGAGGGGNGNPYLGQGTPGTTNTGGGGGGGNSGGSGIVIIQYPE